MYGNKNKLSRENILGTSNKNIYINELLTIESLHNYYHEMMLKIEFNLKCSFYLVDACTSSHLHYMSLEREKIKDLIEIIHSYGFYFSITDKKNKEIFYKKDTIDINSIDISSVNSFKIYKSIFYSDKKTLVFSAREAVIIDFWKEKDGVYTGSIYSDAGKMIAKDLFTQSITTLEIEKMTIPCLKECALIYQEFLDNPIDIVYTWVNDKDKEWLEKKSKTLEKFKSNFFKKNNKRQSSIKSAFSYLKTSKQKDKLTNKTEVNNTKFEEYYKSSIDRVRFANNNELLYSLRSVFTYLKGINNIYIVTDNQIPEFLVENNKIKIILHSEIFKNKKHLPTFSSRGIETQLHHIKGLSKKYLYFNDDMFIGRGNTMRLFFDEYYNPKCFYSTHVIIPPTDNNETYSPVDNAAINNRNLLEKTFKLRVRKKFKHTPTPTIRKVMETLEAKFPDVFEFTASRPFRDNKDYTVAHSLYYHHELIKGKMVPSDLAYKYILLGSKSCSLKLEKLLGKRESYRYDIVCVNSELHTESYKKDVKKFIEIFEIYFPYKGFWEK